MEASTDTGFCRDCLRPAQPADMRCANCHSRRIIRHPEINQLFIAHIDCDAFYAAVEKRDRPDLADKPLIVGGGKRGVVSTACYIARTKGVKSAMPMFKALKLCPEAVVIAPNIRKYAQEGRAVRALIESVTPLVEPLSIDEAFLDLSGTQRLHGTSPARTLARLLLSIEQQVGITASVGLSYNKFLAKLASDLEKPRGFSVIGQAEAKEFLGKRTVKSIWGVGEAFAQRLAKDGLTHIAQLQVMERGELTRRYGVMGLRLYHLARGEDARGVSPREESKSISAETTFNSDTSDADELLKILWELSEKVSARAKAENSAGHTVTLKLKTNGFKTRNRSISLQEPTAMAHQIFATSKPLLIKEAQGEYFRLIGVGLSNLANLPERDTSADLDTHQQALNKAEQAMDKLRHRFGKTAIGKGRSLDRG